MNDAHVVNWHQPLNGQFVVVVVALLLCFLKCNECNDQDSE